MSDMQRKLAGQVSASTITQLLGAFILPGGREIGADGWNGSRLGKLGLGLRLWGCYE